jgi:L-seryl-tRNA(Ser) seleniumtransferase
VSDDGAPERPDADDPRRALPAVGRLLELPAAAEPIERHGRAAVTAALREVLAAARADTAAPRQRASERGRVDAEPPTPEQLLARAVTRVASQQGRAPVRVVNATGVLLHTNLGRAPLSAAAVQALLTASGPIDLEVDLATGERGGRDAPVGDALARLLGAESAFAVNNGAAALVLALASLAGDGGVVVSRGELVEIGGSFRIPDIVRSAGVELIEVGTTNRTHARDYRAAVEAGARAILRVHPSNFRMDGFVHRPTTTELVDIAHAGGVPFIDDLGSGLLQPHPAAANEPVAAEAIAAGASMVLFSGDKLLGGPQAGIIAGNRDLVERCRRAPLARALRLDKLRIAALHATLAAHERGARDDLPVFAMAAASLEQLVDRARALADACDGDVVTLDAVLGGGSTPGATLPSAGVALSGPADALAHRLRTGDPAVLPRIVDDRVVLDLRAVPPSDDAGLRAAVQRAAG